MPLSSHIESYKFLIYSLFSISIKPYRRPQGPQHCGFDMPERDPTCRIVLVGLAGLAVAVGIGRFAFTPLLPMMLADGIIAIPGGGLLATVHFVGYLMGALTAARVPVFSHTRVVRYFRVGASRRIRRPAETGSPRISRQTRVCRDPSATRSTAPDSPVFRPDNPEDISLR